MLSLCSLRFAGHAVHLRPVALGPVGFVFDRVSPVLGIFAIASQASLLITPLIANPIGVGLLGPLLSLS